MPLNYLFVVYPCLTGIPAATIATTYNGIESVRELEELSRQTESLIAYSGGDGPERQFRALLTILMLRDSYGLEVMIPGSEIVLLTDYTSHDPELENDIIAKARELKVCISFYLSDVTWEPYTRIAAQTGGAIVNSIRRESFRHFDDNHDYGQCARFYDLETLTPVIGKRKKRSAATPSFTTEQRCHYFTTSSFTTSLTVQGYTSQPIMIVTRPDSEVVRVTNNFEGNKIYRDTDPIPGQYSVCVESGTLTISLDITDSMSSIFQFLVPTGDSISLNNSPPPACKFAI